MPQRIQRKRTKGWKMPENAVYVGRPTKWGNPYRNGQEAFGARPAMTLGEAVAAYRKWIEACNHRSSIDSTRIREQLRGKDLACWCPLDQPCHADVLLEIANAGAAKEGGKL